MTLPVMIVMKRKQKMKAMTMTLKRKVMLKKGKDDKENPQRSIMETVADKLEIGNVLLVESTEEANEEMG